jgi:hypothetical protein
MTATGGDGAGLEPGDGNWGSVVNASSLLRLYPETWRARYGAGYEALLEDEGINLRVFLDVLVGALDARVQEGANGTRGLFSKLPGWSARTGMSALYLLLALPLGIAYFVFLVTMLALSAGLMITLVGPPLLVLTIAGWWQLARFDRRLTMVLLNTDIAPMSGQATQPWRWDLAENWGRLKTHLKNPVTWKSLLYLFVKFPFGIVAFSIVLLLVAQGLYLASAPIVFHFTDMSFDFVTTTYVIDSWGEALFWFHVGLVLLALGAVATNLMAWGWREFARRTLGARQFELPATPAGAGSPPLGVV